MANSIHVTPRKDGNWQVKQAGHKRASGVFGTQSEAIKSSKQIAINQGLEQVIHGRNNLIREKNSYGNDPCPPRG